MGINDCGPVPAKGVWTCQACHRTYPRPQHRYCPAKVSMQVQYISQELPPGTLPVPPVQDKVTGGPGTELKHLLHRLHIKADGSCACERHAAEMDVNGCDWCEKHIELIVDWMEEEAGKRKFAKLVFTRYGAKKLVQMAIRRARKKELESAAVGLRDHDDA